MEEDRIIELLTRRLAGEASEDELDELDELFLQYPESAYLQDIFAEIWKSKTNEEDADFYYKRHKRRHHGEFGKMAPEVRFENDVSAKATKRQYFLTGAAFLAFLFLTAYRFYFEGRKTSKVARYTEIISGKGIRKSVALPDGTKIWLNADSRISFDANMNLNTTRAVELSGEAFFDVKHSDKQPFLIHTQKVSIKVLGTVFNVKAYPNDRSCETTLIRGSIELVTNNKVKQKFILNPSEKISVINAKWKGTGVTKNVDPGDETASLLIEMVTPVKLSDKVYVPETSWIENKLIFNNEPLEQLAPKLERWFDVKINIANESLRNYRFTGAFTNETIQQALTAMKLIKPFSYSFYAKNITIY